MVKYRFYHVPKTAGTAIFNMTQGWENHKRADPHINHVRIMDIPPEEDETAYAVIRHPYDRYLSAFYHMVDACDDRFYYKNATVSDCDWFSKNGVSMDVFGRDPNVFLRALDDKEYPNHKLALRIYIHFDIFRPQFDWLCDKTCTKIHPKLTTILRHENLEEDFDKIARSLNRTAEWPRDKMSNSRISKSDIPLDNVSKSIIDKWYRNDFTYLFR